MSSLTLDPYEPSILDVLVVKAMLNRAFALPLELIDTVLDMAEYWPHSSAVVQIRKTVHGGRRGLEDQLLVGPLFSFSCRIAVLMSDPYTRPFRSPLGSTPPCSIKVIFFGIGTRSRP